MGQGSRNEHEVSSSSSTHRPSDLMDGFYGENAGSSDGSSDAGMGGLLQRLKEHINKAATEARPAEGLKEDDESEDVAEDEDEEDSDRAGVAQLTLELLEARRIAEVAADNSAANKKRQRRSRRNYVDKRCGVH